MVRNAAFVGDSDEHSEIEDTDEKYVLDFSLKSNTAQEIVQDWIEEATESLFPSSNFLESLKDGILLCNLIKRIQPDLIHDVIESPNRQESLVNVTKFLKGCLGLGLCEWQLFDPEEFSSTEPQSSLEDEVIQKVIGTLYWLGSILKGMSYYGGPMLDVSMFHRDGDGVISVKQRNGLSHHSGDERSLMQPPVYDTRHNNLPQLNGSVPRANGTIPSHLMNGYRDDVTEKESQDEFSVNVRILGDEKRFGFSVMGGSDEGFAPRIDDISEGSPAAKAGLLVGDDILEVNGLPVRDVTHTDVILSIHKCLKNRVIALKLRRRGGFSFIDGHGKHEGSISGQNGVQQGHVEQNTRNKLQKLIHNQENDPEFQYYNSEGESEHSNGDSDVQDFEHLVNNEENEPSTLNGSAWHNNNRSEDSAGVNGKTLVQSNLQKHKSLSTPLFDLTKLDAVDVDIDEDGMENMGCDSESDSDNNAPDDEAVKELRFPVVQELKMKLETDYERERLLFVEELLEKKEYQNATKIYTTIIEQERSSRAPYSTTPATTTALQCSAQVKDSLLDIPDSHEAIELLKILNSPKIEGLLLAHDRLASREVLPDDTDVEDEGEDDEVVDPQRSTDEPWPQIEDDTVKTVRIDKESDPLGATVKNENGAVVIGRIVKGGAADKSGLLRENDEILEINGVNMKGKTVAEVCELLADMNGTLTFLLIPANRSNRVLDREVHVKAHFDYDPYDDDLIPCRELGLAFRRGDILHVVNQEDPHWWQAWRAGEEAGKQLAGLIPSRQFQQQRESMKTSAREKDSSPKEKRFCLCFKRKRRKKVLYNAQRNEDYEADESLSYEEVSLMQPNLSRKRPVVLIGPTKIGRKELKQRLIHFSPDRFSGATPHTSRHIKSGEVNGQDYFFVPRSAFETDIVTHKFVEYGELQGHYYGTSLESIRMVVNSGKTCILNLYCEALKTLKASDLKPYVIFISPPSYDRIRTLRRGRLDPFNPKLMETMNDGEIHDMVNKAREMEDTFGHYFDYTIVNADFERTFDELRQTIDKLESEAQWVPVSWIR